MLAYADGHVRPKHAVQFDIKYLSSPVGTDCLPSLSIERFWIRASVPKTTQNKKKNNYYY
jgi:hypothetical protein